MKEQLEEVKKTLNKINILLYGNPEKSTEISFVSKVNMIFNDISSIKKWLGGSLIFIFTSCLFLGGQLKIIESNSADIKNFIEREQNLETRVSILESIIKDLNLGGSSSGSKEINEVTVVKSRK